MATIVGPACRVEADEKLYRVHAHAMNMSRAALCTCVTTAVLEDDDDDDVAALTFWLLLTLRSISPNRVSIIYDER